MREFAHGIQARFGRLGRRGHCSVEPSATELQELYNIFGYIFTEGRVRARANPRSRNESLAYFMAAMRFMEQRGRSWLIMRRGCVSLTERSRS